MRRRRRIRIRPYLTKKIKILITKIKRKILVERTINEEVKHMCKKEFTNLNFFELNICRI